MTAVLPPRAPLYPAGKLVLHLPTGTLRRTGMRLTDRWGDPWVHLEAWPEGTRPEWAPEHQVVDP